MKWFQGFIEKYMVSVSVAGLFYLAKQSLGFFVSLPELYLYVGSDLSPIVVPVLTSLP